MAQTNPAPQVPPPAKGRKLFLSRPVLSWGLNDLANTIFSSNIVTLFFPFYLTQVIGGDARLDQVASTFITYSNALSGLLIVLLSPLYGVWMDRTGRKKGALVPFTLLAIAFTMLMALASSWGSGAYVLGMPAGIASVLLCFVIAKFFFSSSVVFYDAMISDLGGPKEIPLISGFGVALGYFGTLIGLAVYPLASGQHYEQTFMPSALLYLLFSLPIILFYKESSGEKKSAAVRTGFLSGYKEIITTFKEMKKYRPIFLFMVAFFFFNDALQTAISVMAVYAKTVVGFTTDRFLILYLAATVSSIFGSFIFGYITRRYGAKSAVTSVAVLLIAAIALGTLAVNETMFWAAGVIYGISMGSMWVTSRTLIVELSPPDKRGQFFGLFAFSGKVSSIAGPLLYGTLTYTLQDYGTLASRIALGSLLIMVIIGLFVHARIPKENKVA
ncbi:MFS transporter [Paenibacillus sp. FJAT-26967]|uniref:MFS transporter n=1 Tax=Paenibacillus sp. FJAT-26967 TaxID=1729690 RepID=UPI0008399F75|nr:MFS transporter [Paenibacillus sp. FJAT-26967]